MTDFEKENEVYITSLQMIIDSGKELRESYQEKIAERTRLHKGNINSAELVAVDEMKNGQHLIEQLKTNSAESVYDTLFTQRIRAFEEGNDTYESNFRLQLLERVDILPPQYDFREFRETLARIDKDNQAAANRHYHNSLGARNYTPTAEEIAATTTKEAITLIKERMAIYTPLQILGQFQAGIQYKTLDKVPFITGEDHLSIGATIIQNFGFSEAKQTSTQITNQEGANK